MDSEFCGSFNVSGMTSVSQLGDRLCLGHGRSAPRPLRLRTSAVDCSRRIFSGVASQPCPSIRRWRRGVATGRSPLGVYNPQRIAMPRPEVLVLPRSLLVCPGEGMAADHDNSDASTRRRSRDTQRYLTETSVIKKLTRMFFIDGRGNPACEEEFWT